MKNLFKKILIILAIIGAASLTTSLFLPESTSAATFTGSCRTNFLGLTSWDCGVTISNENDLKNNIWLIAANVATDIAIIAAYLILGYVIYGGYQYIFSSGDPGKVAAGKKTLVHAFIGLAIVMSANLIMGTIRIALVGSGNNLLDCTSTTCVNPSSLVTNLVNWFIGIAGIISAIFLVYGGVSYITSAGDPSKTQKAKQAILYSLIGLIIVAISVAISAFVTGLINNAISSTPINIT